ncbi:Hpt domain-containing protein [Elusimicrobiota bacterium]
MVNDKKKITGNTDPVINKMLNAFIKNKKKDINRIESDLKNNNYDSIYDLSHQLKGAGSLYGLNRISEIGILLEKASLSGDSGSIRKLCTKLEKYLNQL